MAESGTLSPEGSKHLGLDWGIQRALQWTRNDNLWDPQEWRASLLFIGGFITVGTGPRVRNTYWNKWAGSLKWVSTQKMKGFFYSGRDGVCSRRSMNKPWVILHLLGPRFSPPWFTTSWRIFILYHLCCSQGKSRHALKWDAFLRGTS